VDDRRRRELARFGAPAAFLAAATIAVLLIKAGLGGSGASETTPTVGALPTARTATTPRPTTRVTVTASPPATSTGTTTTTTTTATGQYYTVASGDTLGSIAARYSTSVEELMRLNPGVDPTALHVGQKIRVS
jgi:LysM repeat protein